MSYYAAGGYYSAGGFSLKKLGRWAGRTASAVAANPIGKALVGLVPGGSTALAGITLAKGLMGAASPRGPAAAAAITTSQPGTPGATAFAAARGGRRMRGRSRRMRRRFY